MTRVPKLLAYVLFLMLTMSHPHAFAFPVTVTTSSVDPGLSIYYWFAGERVGVPTQNNAPGWIVPPSEYLEFAFDEAVQQVSVTVEELYKPWSVGFPTFFFATDIAGNVLATAELAALSEVGDSGTITLFSDRSDISSLFVEHWFDMDDTVMVTSLSYVTAPEPATLILVAVGGIAALLFKGLFSRHRVV